MTRQTHRLDEPLLHELWQTEWCPASRRVRERLTELGVDYIARQVPVERDDRILLVERTGSDTIPVLVTPVGRTLVGEEAIGGYLEREVAEPEATRSHRLKAERARRRYLEEECKCPQRHRSRSARRPSSRSTRRSSVPVRN